MVDLTEHAEGKLDGVITSIVATPDMRGLCGFFLNILHEDDNPDEIDDFGNPTLGECQAIHDHTYAVYLAVSMILSLDRSIYGDLIKDLSKSYSMGTDQYPQTCDKKVIYAALKKALYGTLIANLLFWWDLSGVLVSWGFKTNPYDSCVMNKKVDGKQCTICWHVYYINILHVIPKVVYVVLSQLTNKYGKV